MHGYGGSPTVLDYVGYDEDRGGVRSPLRALATTAQFQCVLGVNRGFAQRRLPALPVLELPSASGASIGFAESLRARQVAAAVRDWLPEDPRRIYHGHTRASLLVGLWLRAWREARAVVSVHVYGRHRWFYCWAARCFDDRLFWPSPAMRRYYDVDPGLECHQCIPGGVPTTCSRPVPGIPGRLRLGGAGSLVAWKNWGLVIEALACLPEELRRCVTFEHIGEGSPEAFARLSGLAERYRLGDRVVFRDPEPSTARLLREIDALVVASYNEPFSMSMLEALAAGVPVLAADSNGASDIVWHGINGFLFRNGCADALAGTIADWLEQPPQLDPEAVSATSIAADDAAARWREVYDRLAPSG